MAHVLIVEDEKPLADAYQTILTAHKYDVRVAYNGEEALKAVEAQIPDVILLDMKMPKVGGLEFLRGLESRKIAASVIIFSNQDVEADIDEAFSLGAKRYILKSWASPQDLVKIVEEALQ